MKGDSIEASIRVSLRELLTSFWDNLANLTYFRYYLLFWEHTPYRRLFFWLYRLNWNCPIRFCREAENLSELCFYLLPSWVIFIIILFAPHKLKFYCSYPIYLFRFLFYLFPCSNWYYPKRTFLSAVLNYKSNEIILNRLFNRGLSPDLNQLLRFSCHFSRRRLPRHWSNQDLLSLRRIHLSQTSIQSDLTELYHFVRRFWFRSQKFYWTSS